MAVGMGATPETPSFNAYPLSRDQKGGGGSSGTGIAGAPFGTPPGLYGRRKPTGPRASSAGGGSLPDGHTRLTSSVRQLDTCVTHPGAVGETPSGLR